MSDNTIVIVGLKGKEFKNHTIDGDGDMAPPKNIRLSYAGYGYEDGEVWTYNLNSKRKSHPEEILIEDIDGDEKDGVYGIPVVGTWNGIIDLESIQSNIDEAKRIFKERSGQDGKVYIIGEQV